MPKLPDGVEPEKPKSLSVPQLVAALDSVASRVRQLAAEIEALTWQATLHGVRPAKRVRRNDGEIPF